MESPLQGSQQLSEQPKPEKKHLTPAVVTVSFILVVLTVGVVIYYFVHSRPMASNTISFLPSSPPPPNPTAADNEPITAKNSTFEYGNKKLFYARNPDVHYSDQGVTVYLSENGIKAELIREVPIDQAGGGMPEFKPTAKPNIVLLTIASGDMGAFFQEYYFIDLNTKNIVTTRNMNGPTLEINGSDHQISKIQLSITDMCGKGENRKDGASATLNDLTVNGKLQHALAQSRALTCVNPGGIGSIYEPAPVMDFMGLSSDESRVFFSVNTVNWKSGIAHTVWQNNYSFNLNTKVLKVESPTDVLKVSENQ